MKKIKLVFLIIYFVFYSFWMKLRTNRLIKNKSDRYRYGILLKNFYRIIKPLNVDFEIIGKENITDSPQLIPSNHLGYADATLLGIAFDQCPAISKNKPFIYIAKKEINKFILFRPFIKMTPIFLIERNNLRQSVQIIREVSKTSFQHKYSISVFPEGTRNRGEESLLPLKSGALKFSLLNELPIVPTVFIDSDKILIRKRKKKIKVKLIFGQEIPFSKLENLSTQQVTDLVSTKMRQLIEKHKT